MIREMIAKNHLPDYLIEEEPGDLIRFTLRDRVVDLSDAPILSAATLDKARALAPGQDVHALATDWSAFWIRSGRPRLRSTEAAFLGFVRGRV